MITFLFLLFAGCHGPGGLTSIEEASAPSPQLTEQDAGVFRTEAASEVCFIEERQNRNAMIAKIKAIQKDQMHLVVTDGNNNKLIELTNNTTVKRGNETIEWKALIPEQVLIIMGFCKNELCIPIQIELVDTMNGTIDEIMETFPLRLRVQTQSGLKFIQLEEDTSVLSTEGLIDAGVLELGQSIRVFGFPSNSLFIARRIEIETLKSINKSEQSVQTMKPTIILNGTIDEIMETFPLRLRVLTQSGLKFIQLEEDTSVLSTEGLIDAGALKPGQSIRVFGFPSDSLFIARRIEIEAGSHREH